MGIGVQLAGTIGACVLLGLFLDGQFDSSPWFTVALSVVGVVGGLYVSVRDLL